MATGVVVFFFVPTRTPGLEPNQGSRPKARCPYVLWRPEPTFTFPESSSQSAPRDSARVHHCFPLQTTLRHQRATISRVEQTDTQRSVKKATKSETHPESKCARTTPPSTHFWDIHVFILVVVTVFKALCVRGPLIVGQNLDSKTTPLQIHP